MDARNRSPILLVEDEPDDIFFMQRAFRRSGLDHPLLPLPDGEAAIQYLSGQREFSDRSRFPLPCLILTDLKMPLVNGFDLLAWLKTQPQLKDIPAIVLSSSDEPSDRVRAAELGAREYWVKPCQMDILVQLVEHMRKTWVAAHCS
jgi:CheY-like chemotaxis protein